MIECRIIYQLEDFSAFAKVRLNNAPKETTIVDLIFVRMRTQIKIAFGYGKECPSLEDETNYNNLMAIGKEFIYKINHNGIE